jgi:hypothetical protein
MVIVWRGMMTEGTMVAETNKRDARGQVLLVDPASEDDRRLVMGTGACTICDCPSFVASGGGNICGNQNSEGGTCNHWDYEHN